MTDFSKWSRCGNCRGVFLTDNLGAVQDLGERVAPGEVAPSGECPTCGAVCHLMRPDVVIEVSGGVVQAVYTDAPMSVVVVDWDNIKVGDRRLDERVPEWLTQMPPETKQHVIQTITDQLKEAGVDA